MKGSPKISEAVYWTAWHFVREDDNVCYLNCWHFRNTVRCV